LLPTNVAVLPVPYLDLDPAFLLTRWAAEINTTRRSDHDARFKVLWGPLAAGIAQVGLNAPAAWAPAAGPLALGGLGTAARQRLTWLFSTDGVRNLSASYTTQLQLPPALLAASTLRPLTLAHVPGFGDTQSTAPQA
jgi:hypothetical protein